MIHPKYIFLMCSNNWRQLRGSARKLFIAPRQRTFLYLERYTKSFVIKESSQGDAVVTWTDAGLY